MALVKGNGILHHTNDSTDSGEDGNKDKNLPHGSSGSFLKLPCEPIHFELKIGTIY